MTTPPMTRNECLAAERDAVRELVRRVGTWRLRFDVQDVRAEMEATPWLALHEPGKLALRLRDLEGSCITRVDGTFAFILAQRTSREARANGESTPTKRGGQPGARVTHQYVLNERLHELTLARPDALDDLERVALAVAVATLTLGGAPAPTRLVTTVLGTVPDLMLQHPTQQTNVLLGRLARREEPLLAESKAGAERSARWTLIEPLKGVWLDWVREQATAHREALGAAQLTAAAGAASQAQIVAKLVEAATRHSHSSHWPSGHPVSAREIAGCVAEARQSGHDPLGVVPLADALDRQGATLTAALQAATREQFADGSTRRVALVRRVEHPRFRGLRYAPAAFDAKRERAWVEWTVLRRETRPQVLDALGEDWQGATVLARSADAAVQAVGLVRQVAIREVVEARMAVADALVAPFSTISALLSRELDQMHEALLELANGWPKMATLESAARAVLTLRGISLPEALGATRPVVTAEAMTAMLPASVTVDLAPSVLAATAITVRRAERPRAGRTTRVGKGRSESLPLDRVDAVHYAAETGRLPGVVAIQMGVQLVGAFVAHVGLIRRVAAAARAEDRVAAYGALLLLGDVAYLGKLLRKRARELAGIAAQVESTSLVELAWWLEKEAREEIVAAGFRDERQAVKAAARRVVE